MSDPYTKGFNEGYVIAERLPELGDDLSKIESASPWMEGFRDGRRHYLLEHLGKMLSAPPRVGRYSEYAFPYTRNGAQEHDGEGRDAER